uniref:Interferon regulatory factor 7 n=1 Tax=Ficedula albicollis TaxID=59894 RepID=U3KC63_FICAL
MAAPEKEGEAQKLRFGPWLLSAIDSGSYRGLRWIDSARTIFRVPWKHNARKDITSSDLEVFKAWAKVSGRYEEGSEDPAKWKTNFRCALSSTHMFRLEYDHSKRGDDPHKVFSIVSGEPRPMEELCWVGWGGQSMDLPLQVLSFQLPSRTVRREIPTSYPLCSPLESTDPTQLSILEELLQQCGISPRDFGSQAASWVPAGETSSAPPAHRWLPCRGHSSPGCPAPASPGRPAPASPGHPAPASPGDPAPASPGHPAPALHRHQPKQLLPYGILDVTIYYRGKEFHREVVGGSHCLLTYQPPGLAEAPCPWQVVRFPSPAGVADGKQRRITEELLGVAGLQLEIRASKVFATRRKKCKVFWALSQQLEGGEEPPPNLLCRDQETPIFDFNEFCTELWDFHIGQRRRSPDFTIYLCFGQAFSKAKPKESKLILVKLVPKVCELYYEQFLQAGASSLDSHTISLQLSNSLDLMELIEQYNMQLG